VVTTNFEALDRPGSFARVDLLRPLRAGDFRRLWAGQTVSLVGDGVFLIASVWTAYALWNTPAATAVLGIAMTVPTIAFLLVGEAISDRADRRLVMLCSDVVRGLVVAGLTALLVAHELSFPAPAVLTAVYGAATAFFTPAFKALVPCIVAERDLPQANSLDQLVRPAALRLVGPALGGWVVSFFGAETAFALDAATFVALTAAVASLPPCALRPVARMRRRRRRSRTASASCAGMSGSGARCSRQRSRTSRSSAPRRRSCPTWSGTSCTPPRGRSASSSPQAASARSRWAPTDSPGGT
jgi:hypothetical protein